MTSNIVESHLFRFNIYFVFIIMIFIFPILIASLDISLSLYLTLFIGFCYGIYTEKLTDEIPVGIPIAKVIWTKHWEEESIKFVLTYDLTNIHTPINLFNFHMEYCIYRWNELHVNSFNNTYQTLYNYNRQEPVQGIYLDYRSMLLPN